VNPFSEAMFVFTPRILGAKINIVHMGIANRAIDQVRPIPETKQFDSVNTFEPICEKEFSK
jgi:hypothetical protein